MAVPSQVGDQVGDDPSPKPDLSLVVPVYNESATLTDFLTVVSQIVKPLVERFEIVVIDDGSVDATWSILRGARSDMPQLRCYRLSRNFGKDAAMSAGIELARGRLCLVMDGDFEHPPQLIKDMLKAYQTSGANVVNAVKTRARTEKYSDRFLAHQFYRLFRWLSGYDLAGHTDFKLFDQSARQAWLRFQERGVFFRGLMAWVGYKQTDVPFTVPDLPSRSTRWSRPKLIALALKSLTSFSALPLQIVTALGLLNLLFAVPLGLQTLYQWWSGKAVEGFTTIICLQLFQSSITMLALGMLGLYLARVSEEVKRRPRFLISEEMP